jgi:hypothetical protein
MATPEQFSILLPVAIADTGGFTRASTATYYGAGGVRVSAGVDVPRWHRTTVGSKAKGLLLENAATNLTIRSEDFTNAVWGKNNVTVSTGTGVLGADNTAMTLATVTTGAASQRYIRQAATVTVGETHSFGIDIGAAAGSEVVALRVFIGDAAFTNGVYMDVDLVSGEVLTPPTVYGAASYVHHAVDIFDAVPARRPHLTAQVPGVSSLNYGVIALNTANIGNATVCPSWTPSVAAAFSLDCGQLETGLPSTYIPTVSAAATRAADVLTAQLLSNISEPDSSGTYQDSTLTAWSAASTYALTARVIYQHKIYECILAVSPASAVTPDVDVTHWVEVGPTNKWAMFDAANSSQTVGDSSTAGEILVALNPADVIDSVVLDNLDADYVRVLGSNVGGTYDQQVDLRSRSVSDWYSYFFTPFTFKRSAMFNGIPPLTSTVVSIVIAQAANSPKCGTLVAGIRKPIGYAQPGAGVGLIDYSVKSTDAFGNTTVVPRPYSKRMNVEVMIQNDVLDVVQELLAQLRSTPVVWSAAGSLFNATTIYGYYKSFDIVIAYPTQSICNFEIEGLT